MNENKNLTLKDLIRLLQYKVQVETSLSHGELIGIDVEQGTIKVRDANHDGKVYYAQINDGVKLYKSGINIEKLAKEFSFNIPSELFHTLNEEQQKLWKKEIEQAFINGVLTTTHNLFRNDII